MIEHKDHFHGSDLEKIQEIYGIRKEDILSFSANVNPLGISPLLRSTLASRIDAVTSYPDREYTALRKSIAAYTGADAEHIIVGNGSTELISLFVQIEHPKKALIIGPSYSEYEREVTMGGGTALYYPLREKDGFQLNMEDFLGKLNDSIDLLIICNPNNPTSTAISREDMRRILDECMSHGIYVMIDETYVEFAPNVQKLTAVPLAAVYNNVIILRGISKFFAAPGLRLGYAVVGNRDLLKEINAKKNPWTINSLAEIAGELMFRDKDYIEETRSLISSERERVYRILCGMASVKAYEPVANFVLVRILKSGVTAMDLFEHAIRQGYMIRDCSTFPFLDERYFRFCFMKPEQDDALLACLRELL